MQNQDDTIYNRDENEAAGSTGSGPMYETVVESGQSPPQEDQAGEPEAVEMQDTGGLTPEAAPEDLTPEEISQGAPPPDSGEPVVMPSDDSEGPGKGKILVIVGFIVIFLILFFGLIFFFLGRGRSENKKNENVTLTYWGLWEPEQVVKPLIDAYQATNPNVKIVYKMMDHVDYKEKLIQRTLAGDGPDIFRYHNTWVPMLWKDVLSAVPKNIMTIEEFQKTFYNVAASDLTINDSIVGIPLAIDGLVLFCNDDLLKAAGFETLPTTWEEVINIASSVAAQDENSKLITAGIALGTADNIEHFSDILGWMILQNGGSIKDLAAKESVDALEEFRAFADPPKNLWDSDMPNSIQAFIQGDVGMIFAPSWQALTIKQANPELKFRMTTLPVLDPSNKVFLASYWAEGVSKASKNQQEAWKFVKYLSEAENMTKLYQLQVETDRAFGEPYSRVDLASKLAQDEYVGPVISMADSMFSIPTISRTFDSGLNDEIIAYLKDAVNATVSGVSPQGAMATAQSGVSQVLSKYSIE